MSIKQIPNLVQGVSQQAPQHRRDTQCQAQFDCLNSVTEGCAARPHFEVIETWAARDLSEAFLEAFSRGGEYYLVGIGAAAPFAINLETGVDCTITGDDYPNDTAYLDAVVGVEPRDQFRMQAVEDTIFVANRRISPVMDATSVSATLTPEGIAFFKLPAGSTHDVTVSLTGPATETATVNDVGEYPQNQAGSIATAIDGDNGYLAVAYGPLVHITRGDAADFDMAVNHTAGEEYAYGLKDYVSAYSRLPNTGIENFKIKVRGESKSRDDDFWVQFIGGPSTGVWEEVVAPATETLIDPVTMPHTLINTGVNTFTWQKKDWSARIVGDADTTAKDPSFIGSYIRDLFYHKARLGILLEAGAVWSKARFPYTFFPDTVQTILDTAPVDVTMAAAQTSGRGSVELDFSVQIDKTMNFWGQGTQFEITSGQDNFKQDSISADPTTAYEYSPNSRPLSLGKFLYFPTEAGPWATLYAIQYQNQRAGIEVNVGQHVPRYLASGVRRMTGSTALNVIFIQTDGDPENLYVWNHLFNGQEFLQSAWNTWRVPGGDILWVGMRSNYLYALQQRGADAALLRCDLTPQAVDDIAGAYYLTRLDLRVDQSQVSSLSYDAGDDQTTFTLPYTPTGDEDTFKVVMAETSGTLYRGRVMPIVSIVGAVVVVEGDLSGGKKFYAGETISAERTESQFHVRAEQGPVPFDSLTLNRYGVDVSSTGYTRIEIEDNGGNVKSYEYTGQTAGLPGSLIGPPMVGDKLHHAPIDLKNTNCTITLVNDSFLPSYWQAAHYQYTAVGKMSDTK